MEAFTNFLEKFNDFKDSLKSNNTVIKALQEERPELAKKLIVKGRGIHNRDDLGNTSLHYAAALGYNEVIQALLEHGANIETENYEGQTPLIYAMEYHQIEVAKILWSYSQMSRQRHLQNNGNKILINELCAIGVDCSLEYGAGNSGFFQKSSVSATEYFLNPRTVEIGKILNNQGGMESMIEAHNAVRKTIGKRAAIELSSAWHGIGNWLH